jgi:hypothetical protein
MIFDNFIISLINLFNISTSEAWIYNVNDVTDATGINIVPI